MDDVHRLASTCEFSISEYYELIKCIEFVAEERRRIEDQVHEYEFHGLTSETLLRKIKYFESLEQNLYALRAVAFGMLGRTQAGKTK